MQIASVSVIVLGINEKGSLRMYHYPAAAHVTVSISKELCMFSTGCALRQCAWRNDCTELCWTI